MMKTDPIYCHAYLGDQIEKIADEKLRALCLRVVDDRRFVDAPAAKDHHHNYRGGLLEHTYEVVSNCAQLDNASTSFSVLVAAAVWHDYHKIFEYVIAADGAIASTSYKKRVGHVVGSAADFRDQAHAVGLDSDLREEIQHCILAHHGRLEWGSPVEPQTREAMILHAADMMSSRGL